MNTGDPQLIPPSTPLVEAPLLDDLVASWDSSNSRFSWSTFFAEWFMSKGTPYFFLFKRHLGVTNLQYTELFSLIRLYCRSSPPSAGSPPLLLRTATDVRRLIQEGIELAVSDSNDNPADIIRTSALPYVPQLLATAAIDMFHCSCVVYMPPGLDVDLARLCADSGYVLAAGRAAFVRTIHKATECDLHASLRRHCDRSSLPTSPIPFIVHAHEDLSPGVQAKQHLLQDGIASTKIHLDKMTMRGRRLADVVRTLAQAFPKHLRPLSMSECQLSGTSFPRSIWMLVDRAASFSTPQVPGDKRYYICYEQEYCVETPFYYFDENKPAWKSHTTMPHSLTAALINAARPLAPRSVIQDPFGGTGTTWLEAKRLLPTCECRCTDKSEATATLIRDNLLFFLLTGAQLGELRTRLQSTVTDLSSTSADVRGAPAIPMKGGKALYFAAMKLLAELRMAEPHEEFEFTFSQSFVEALSNEHPVVRLGFYVALRGHVRYRSQVERGSMTSEEAFSHAADELLRDIELWHPHRLKIDGNARPPDPAPLFICGRYSRAVVPSFFQRYSPELLKIMDAEVATQDATSLLPDSVHLLLCDPPYGVNTPTDAKELGQLYSRFLPRAVAALKHGGQLIICLPAEIYTGRRLPFCTRASIVTNQVLLAAAQQGRSIVSPQRDGPHLLARPPYYWVSPRALRRTVLHFRVLDCVSSTEHSAE